MGQGQQGPCWAWRVSELAHEARVTNLSFLSLTQVCPQALPLPAGPARPLQPSPSRASALQGPSWLRGQSSRKTGRPSQGKEH